MLIHRRPNGLDLPFSSEITPQSVYESRRTFIKQMAVGTTLGRIALSARDFFSVLRAPRDKVGCLVNDQLAAKLVTRLCRGTFIDVGAHIGSVMADVRGCNIVAIEAMPDKAATLRRKFPAAVIHACAVGEFEREVDFFVDRAQSGYSSLSSYREGTERITVPLRTLDSLVTEADVIKIDVEGAELGVLRGAEKLIARSRPVIMFESAPGEPMYSKADIWQWFSEHGYVLLVPDRVAHNGPGLSAEGFAESHWYPRRTTNYFAAPAERRDEIRERARSLLAGPDIHRRARGRCRPEEV